MSQEELFKKLKDYMSKDEAKLEINKFDEMNFKSIKEKKLVIFLEILY